MNFIQTKIFILLSFAIFTNADLTKIHYTGHLTSEVLEAWDFDDYNATSIKLRTRGIISLDDNVFPNTKIFKI